jgi:hypothetical protein
MSVLPLTDGIDATTLPDETANGRIFMPHITQFNFGDLPERVVAETVLEERQQDEFPNKLAPRRRIEKFQGQVSRRGRGTDDTDRLDTINGEQR